MSTFGIENLKMSLDNEKNKAFDYNACFYCHLLSIDILHWLINCKINKNV